jgi:hypothetical protein
MHEGNEMRGQMKDVNNDIQRLTIVIRAPVPVHPVPPLIEMGRAGVTLAQHKHCTIVATSTERQASMHTRWLLLCVPACARLTFMHGSETIKTGYGTPGAGRASTQ